MSENKNAIKHGKFGWICPNCENECNHLEPNDKRELEHIYTHKNECCYCQEKDKERPNLFRVCGTCNNKIYSYKMINS
jgi:hypothetical protein